MEPDVLWHDSCGNCGCAATWHRLDDSENVSPVDAEARFRCDGFEFRGCALQCPDFVKDRREPVMAEVIANG